VSNGKVEAFANWGPFFLGGWLAQSDHMGPRCRGRVRKKEERWGPHGYSNLWANRNATTEKATVEGILTGQTTARRKQLHSVTALGGGVDHIEDPESTCNIYMMTDEVLFIYFFWFLCVL
jgi:hypothetical protein